jgi:hypothetical protein
MAENQDMSVQEAAAIVQDARTRARRELVISTPVVFTAAGLVWLIGYGAMWLSVRGQHPYRSPSGVSIAVVLVLAAFAVAAVSVVVHRATAGIGGRSVLYRRIVLAAYVGGYVVLLMVQAAVSGSVRAFAFVGFAGPLLLAGLIYILASVLGRNRLAFALGTCLVIVAASCAWLAPPAILAACALGGGGAFLLTALIGTRLRAHAS